MQPLFDAARRYRWAVVIVLALTWGTGAAMAYTEYKNSFEADATVWTDRQSQRFTTLSPQDPGLASFVTPAAEQAELLTQLLRTRTFLQGVVGRSSIARPEGTDERAFFDQISKLFRVDVLGTNLFRLSYRARDPHTGVEMVRAALAERQQRLAETRTSTTAAAKTFYESDLQVAQKAVVIARQELDSFDGTHKAPLSPGEDYLQGQLRVAVAQARAHVTDLQTRIDSSAKLPSVLGAADILDFQVIDQPLERDGPTGGGRPALIIAGSAGVAGLAIVGLLLISATLLAGAKGRATGRVPADSEDPSAGEFPIPHGPSLAPNSSQPTAVRHGRQVPLAWETSLVQTSTERTRVATRSDAPAR